jgi:hypothetical protein
MSSIWIRGVGAGGAAVAAVIVGYTTDLLATGSRQPVVVAAVVVAGGVLVSCEVWLATRRSREGGTVGTTTASGNLSITGETTGPVVYGNGNRVLVCGPASFEAASSEPPDAR